MERILIATDGSSAAREAVHFGLELAADEGAAVTFVHVAPDTEPVQVGVYGVAAVRHQPTPRDYATLVAACALAAERGVEAATKLLQGNPADEIVAYADSIGADLIVVGSRGPRRVAGPLLVSVSRDVLTESRRPVLVVRGSATPVEAEAVSAL